MNAGTLQAQIPTASLAVVLEFPTLARWARTFESMRVALGVRARTIHVDVPAIAANDATPADALLELLERAED